MKRYKLNAQPRTLTGRHVKKLRQQGLVPGTVYGKNTQSLSLAVGGGEFALVWQEAGESGLVDLTLDGQARPVLIHSVQKDAVSGHPLHVEFFQVNLKEKVHANVPVQLVGESPAVMGKVGTLLTVLDELEVESLPTDLPEHIVLDVSGLAQVGEEIKVSAIKAPSGVTIIAEPGLTVVKVAPLVSKEAEEQIAAEAAAAEAAAALSQAPAPLAEAAPIPTTEPPQAPQAEEK